MNSIPIGTPCYVVRAKDDHEIVGRVCTVIDHGPHPRCPFCKDDARQFYKAAVAHARLPDRWVMHVEEWSQLKPITPPDDGQTQRRLEGAAA